MDHVTWAPTYFNFISFFEQMVFFLGLLSWESWLSSTIKRGFGASIYVKKKLTFTLHMQNIWWGGISILGTTCRINLLISTYYVTIQWNVCTNYNQCNQPTLEKKNPDFTCGPHICLIHSKDKYMAIYLEFALQPKWRITMDYLT